MKWRIPTAICSAILFLWGISPFLIARIVNIGVIVPVAVGALGVSAVIFHRQATRMVHAVLHGKKSVQITAGIVCVCILALILLFIAVSVVMVANATRTAPDENVTLVVPGAKINGTAPSLMLYGRLVVAAEYLKEHQSVQCVVSGGQGEDEPCAEATVMREYLIRLGVQPERIYVEDQSTSTFENMQYTYQVIRENALPEKVVIATQEFHQYRCAQYARQAALAPVGTATCGTPWYLFLCYWVREFAGINRMWLLGY